MQYASDNAPLPKILIAEPTASALKTGQPPFSIRNLGQAGAGALIRGRSKIDRQMPNLFSVCY
jgi:hypothetical protein